MHVLALSQILFFAAFAGYVVATIIYVARLTGQKRRAAAVPSAGGAGTPSLALDRPARIAGYLVIGAVALQGAGILLRWAASGQAPMSNMYEYMSLTGWAAMLFFVLLNLRYNLPALGAFAAPVGVLVIAYASVFPSKVQPLVAPLQSYWLTLHVSFAALGEGAFAVSFAAALMYLLRIRRDGQLNRVEETILEGMFASGAILAGFILSALIFRLAGYELVVADAGGSPLLYHLPPFAAPQGIARGELGSFAGLPLPLFAAPAWMGGVAAGRKLNTLLISLVAGALIYGLVRLLARRSWREMATGPVATISPETMDDISYRGIAVGFPLFTLGGMVFAMIWAQKAWGSYWSWDPKETWSLISWLFYSGYLHMRIVRGWEGRPAAWIASVGFILIIFTLVGVNLLISGLHSYAGS